MCSILEVLNDGFGNPKHAPCPLLVNMVTAGKLGLSLEKGSMTILKGRSIKLSKQFVK